MRHRRVDHRTRSLCSDRHRRGCRSRDAGSGEGPRRHAAVRFIEADLFSWRPDRRYDTVFFGFWLSHVPEEHFDSFWSLVDDCLRPDGEVFFFDDNYRTEAELIEGVSSPVVERRAGDGTPFRIIKVPLQPGALERRLHLLGWDITVNPTAGPFFGAQADAEATCRHRARRTRAGTAALERYGGMAVATRACSDRGYRPRRGDDGSTRQRTNG